MARIFTTPEAETAAKSFLHDLTLAGGLRTKDLRPSPSYWVSDSNWIGYAKTICDELVNRDFNNINSAINQISRYSFPKDISSSRGGKRFKPEAVAKSIVYMAELIGAYWDDTLKTPYEIDEFKSTLLGSAVYKYGRVLSALATKRTRTASGGGASAQGQPKNGYKSSGPQSGNVRDLQGQPNEKVVAEGPYIYKIIGDNPQSKNTPNVFIKPLSASGVTGTTNKIFISSGNGYTDCTCYFDDPNEAQSFLDKIEQAGRVPANVTNLRVVKNKADSNGYFLVGTEFGVCAVSAKTLNEALIESAIDPSAGWENATAGYSKEELEELHTWMRKD